MWRFLQRLGLRQHDASANGQAARDADHIRNLLAPLRRIEPDATARSEGRAKLQAALVTARAERSRPRLAGVRAFTIAAAGIAGSSVLVASAATGTDPVTMVVNVADWSVPAWDRSPDLLRESVTVQSHDPGTGILEGTTIDGVPVTLLIPRPDRSRPDSSTDAVDEPLERGTRIDVTFEAAGDASEPALVTAVEIVSTPPPDLAREPAPTEDASPTRDPAPTVPNETGLADPRETPKVDDRDEPSIATVEPSPTEPKDEGDPDLNTGALDPVSTGTPSPSPTPTPTPKPLEPADITPGSSVGDENDGAVTNNEMKTETTKTNLEEEADSPGYPLSR